MTKPSSTLLHHSPVSWPTVATFLGAMAVWTTSWALTAQGRISFLGTIVISTLSAFVIFTPLHESVHNSIARARWVNEAIGRLSVWVMLAPFPAFRLCHLDHHRHTNEAGADPDQWSGRGPSWLRPLRWASQDFYYYYYIATHWSSLRRPEKIETLVTAAGVLAAAGVFIALGQGPLFFLCWFVPARLVKMLLAFSFDYLPHRPHHVSVQEDRYRATLVYSYPFLTPILLYQNYHLIHHLYPAIPFYRYSRVWREQREALLAKGVRDLRYT